MKKFFILALVATFFAANAQSQDDFRTPFLDESLTTIPEYPFWVESPPKLTSGAFANDFYYYQWGLEQRTISGIAEIAKYDESAELRDVFGPILGVKLTAETTPEILRLVEGATADAHRANTVVKNKYQRKRPFATFKDASLLPENDEEEAATFSYPSGHSSRGYMFAMVLATLDPTKTPELMVRADLYAENRVICGRHWKSDIDASLFLAAGVFAMVVSTNAFQEQLKKARAEYEQIKSSTRVDAPKAAAISGNAAIYDMQGRQLDAAPNNGMYIQNGKKYIQK